MDPVMVGHIAIGAISLATAVVAAVSGWHTKKQLQVIKVQLNGRLDEALRLAARHAEQLKTD